MDLIEILILNQPSWTWIELFYFAVGLLMLMLGLLIRRSQRTRQGR